MSPRSDRADLAATFVFALEGAIAGALVYLDVFGVIVVAFATAVSGGIVRDVLIGALPPATVRSISYPAAVAGAAVAVAVARRGFGRAGAMALGAMVCFALRAVADWQNWNLPKVNTG